MNLWPVEDFFTSLLQTFSKPVKKWEKKYTGQRFISTKVTYYKIHILVIPIFSKDFEKFTAGSLSQENRFVVSVLLADAAHVRLPIWISLFY